MKKLLVLSLFAFLISFNTQAQDEESVAAIDKKHEVRLGALKLLAGPIFEGVYEYVPNSNTGFGAALLVNLNGDNDYLEDYSITPFYRMYFQTKEDYGAKGFFAEGFTSFFGGKNDEDAFYDFNTNTTRFEGGEGFFDISVGLSVGKKWVNSSGFVFEAKFGVGRNLLGTADIDLLVKGDLYIGYRF